MHFGCLQPVHFWQCFLFLVLVLVLAGIDVREAVDGCVDVLELSVEDRDVVMAIDGGCKEVMVATGELTTDGAEVTDDRKLLAVVVGEVRDD